MPLDDLGYAFLNTNKIHSMTKTVLLHIPFLEVFASANYKTITEFTLTFLK